MNKCLYCPTTFIPGAGSTGKFCSLTCSSQHRGELLHKKAVTNYYLTPKFCKKCNTTISYEYRKSNKFCSRSCAATFNNAKKNWAIITTGPAPKPKIVKISILKNNISASNCIPVGPYTRIYLCKCKFTGKKWYSATRKTIHPSAATTRKLYSYQCKFNFGITRYPEWFQYASELINMHGWYSASNRGNNLSGCSRDHLYSVSDGFKNNILPSLLAHPANCGIIPHRQNQSKNKNSSITLDELYIRINQFDLHYLESVPGI
jgi:hypothetical protein